MSRIVNGRVWVPVGVVGVVIAGMTALAGPINPPVGPVASTFKTLSEVEPRIAINATNTPGDATSLFKITQPGSYYLTGNITGVVGKHGIAIAAGGSGVTLDLMGFDLVGVAGSLDGVSVTVVGLTNIAVVNGSVRNWGDEGVDLASVGPTNNCRVEGVLASGNTGSGISAGNASTVTNCSAYLNTGNGISAVSGCTISNCSAYNNTGNGITTGSGCTVSNCSANQNTGTGIIVSSGSSSSTVSNCSAFQNAASGISVSTGGTAADCTARFNTLDGIVCNAACMIRGNTCSSNGFNGDGANIHATAGANRIEGNTCTGADRGIDVDAAGNFIIKNTCKANTIDWVIAANNTYGPIIDRRIPSPIASTPAVSGTSAASTLGTTDPNANFTY